MILLDSATLRKGLVVILCALPAPLLAFTLSAIQVEGTQRIGQATVRDNLGLEAGDTLHVQDTPELLHRLYRTGFFRSVRLQREQGVLRVLLEERPIIDKVSISGQESIKEEDLLKGLAELGLEKGKFFDPADLEQTEQVLHNQYAGLGKYGVAVTTEVEPLDGNQVDIHITVDEGRSARIHRLQVNGNHAFNDAVLLSRFQLTTDSLFSNLSDANQYSSIRLAADQETLRSYYLNRGYARFALASSQVMITPDHTGISVTLNVDEGALYHIKKIDISPVPGYPDALLRKALTIHPGDPFSRKNILETVAQLRDILTNDGYAFADVQTLPVLDDDTHTATLRFLLTRGDRITVRRIRFEGHRKTMDDVLRREMRQMEGGWISAANVQRSRIRLQRLPYLGGVQVHSEPVSGNSDLVDLVFKVDEKSSGSLAAGVGFSQGQGLLFNASVTENNFLGTGKSVALNLNNSQVNTVYRMSYTDPYYTPEGISRTLDLSFRNTTAGSASIADFISDNLVLGAGYGIPLTEFNQLNLRFSAERSSIKETLNTPQEYHAYLANNRNNFSLLRGRISWSHDTRNKTVFATEGSRNILGMDLALPGSQLTFAKWRYDGQFYQPLNDFLTLLLKGSLAYGRAYGGTTGLPFFESYFTGGVQSVRGYRINSLGPRSRAGNSPLGGAAKTVLNAEVIFPWPFSGDGEAPDNVRLSLFLDAGNVYRHLKDVDYRQLRYSTGLSLVWLSPLGPINLSVARPIKKRLSDETQFFQFSLGTLF